jgi:hypothetical protein
MHEDAGCALRYRNGHMNVTAAKNTEAMTCALKLVVGFQPRQVNTLIHLSVNDFDCRDKEGNVLE